MITLEKYKEQIDAYFDVTPPSEIIKRFEALGYEFEPIDSSESNEDDLHSAKINKEFVDVSDISVFDSKEIFNEYTQSDSFPASGTFFSSIFSFHKTLLPNIVPTSDILLQNFSVNEKFDFFFKQIEVKEEDYEEVSYTQNYAKAA